MNTVGEPYSGKPNVRFDEGRLARIFRTSRLLHRTGASPEIGDLRTALVAMLGGLAAAGATLIAALNLAESRRQKTVAEEREISARTGRAIAARMGVEDALAELAEASVVVIDEIDPNPVTERPWRPSTLDDEVARRVQGVEERMRAIEEKSPDKTGLQKFADANQLFLAYQVAELSKRLDRLEEKQLSSSQVIGIVLAMLATLVGVTSVLFAVLRTVALIH